MGKGERIGWVYFSHPGLHRHEPDLVLHVPAYAPPHSKRTSEPE
jgi:hypothetical protein